eukprot:Phypoly_transcript_07899.p1 GENE.Phypoly_transcript_07899~~Phypoly_transcript_07899.p1  ORF type:complete len:411 (+),score=58.21 Phypoly_transcript_07899:35-1234(+)
MATDDAFQFGHSLLKQFKLAPDYVNMNHGSFGTTPISVLEKQREYVDLMEARPDVWYRKTYRELVVETRKQLAACFNAEEEGLILVENASTGVNSVLRALKWHEEDAILYLSTAYPMVVHTLTYLHDTFNVHLKKVDIQFPMSSNSIVENVEQAILQTANGAEKSQKIRVAVFSHITSVPAITLPVEKLIELCHKHNILVLLDGAHAPGQIPLDLKALGADFYTGNLHKWFYSPKGSAFLYIAPSFRSLVVPTVISSEFAGARSLDSKFQYTGTRDYTAFCAIPTAIAFRKRIGDSQIYEYLHKLAIDGGKLLSSMWGTEVLHTEEAMVGSMVNVRLPTHNAALANLLSQTLLEKHNTFIVVFELQGNFWTRVSAAIYLEISDFKWLGEIVSHALGEAK